MSKISTDSAATNLLLRAKVSVPKPQTVKATDFLPSDRVSLSGADDPRVAKGYAGRKPLEVDDEVRGRTPEESARMLVLKALKEYGVSTTIDLGDGTSKELSEITPEEAAELVAEDGYWGVEQTSERMFSMMKALAGGDPARLEEIKTGIARGFEQARMAFGGSLPDISYRTRDRLLEKLDAWAAEPAPAAGPEAVTAASMQQAALGTLARSV